MISLRFFGKILTVSLFLLLAACEKSDYARCLEYMEHERDCDSLDPR